MHAHIQIHAYTYVFMYIYIYMDSSVSVCAHAGRRGCIFGRRTCESASACIWVRASTRGGSHFSALTDHRWNSLMNPRRVRRRCSSESVATTFLSPRSFACPSDGPVEPVLRQAISMHEHCTAAACSCKTCCASFAFCRTSRGRWSSTPQPSSRWAYQHTCSSTQVMKSCILCLGAVQFPRILWGESQRQHVKDDKVKRTSCDRKQKQRSDV